MLLISDICLVLSNKSSFTKGSQTRINFDKRVSWHITAFIPTEIQGGQYVLSDLKKASHKYVRFNLEYCLESRLIQNEAYMSIGLFPFLIREPVLNAVLTL